MRCPLLSAAEIWRVAFKKILSCFDAVWWNVVFT